VYHYHYIDVIVVVINITITTTITFGIITIEFKFKPNRVKFENQVSWFVGSTGLISLTSSLKLVGKEQTNNLSRRIQK
jgi:hypothetical protein